MSKKYREAIARLTDLPIHSTVVAMPLKIRCPSGHLLGVPKKRAGTTVSCPKCGQPVEVPALVPPSTRTVKNNETPPLPDSSEACYDDPLPPPVQESGKDDSESGKLLLEKTPPSSKRPSSKRPGDSSKRSQRLPQKKTSSSPSNTETAKKSKSAPEVDSRETKLTPAPPVDALHASSPANVGPPERQSRKPVERVSQSEDGVATSTLKSSVEKEAATSGKDLPAQAPAETSPQDQESISEKFDPYYKWLAIAPDEQPANHYRLIGVREFEDDPDVIDSAAEQRITHLRKFQSGRRGKLSQQLLNEVSIARICLLNAEKRKVYNRELERRLSKHKPPIPPPFEQDRPKPPPVSASQLEQFSVASPAREEIVAGSPGSSTRPAPRVENDTPSAWAPEESSSPAALVDGFDSDRQQEEEAKVAGYEHDSRNCRKAYYLGLALALLGLLTLIPSVMDVAEHLDPINKSPGVARWAFPLALLSIVQLAYALYLFQLPDWSCVWVVTLAMLVLSTIYAVMMGVLFLSGADHGLVAFLQFHDLAKARLWCLILLSLTSLLTYFCGRASIRWHKADVGQLARTNESAM